MDAIAKILEPILKIVVEAGDLGVTLRQKGFEIQEKTGPSDLVTNVDKALDAVLCENLSKFFPNDEIVSEESLPFYKGNKEKTWFVDPIDGTSDFVQGTGEWSVMVGLAFGKEVKLGIVYQPEKRKLYYGSSQGAFLQEGGKKTALKILPPSNQPTRIVDSRNHPEKHVPSFLKHASEYTLLHQGSLGLKLAVLAEGKADLYINSSGKSSLWDLVSGEAIIRAAGGGVFAKDGTPFEYIAPGKEKIQSTFFVCHPGRVAAIAKVLR